MAQNLVILICVCIFGLSLGAQAAEDFEGKDQMNGLRLSDYKDFEKTWRLVTVRFRKDTDELRWVFANDLAWKALEAGTLNYPDGAVFAKIGIRTLPDPLFESSAVPSGARRYQLMVRDAKKYKTTGGWGYGLFDVNGKTFPEDPVAVAQACAACHKVAEPRGQVFSQPFVLAPSVKFHPIGQSMGDSSPRGIEFGWMPIAKISSVIRSHLPVGTKQVRIVSNSDLTTRLFQGTLNEMIPALEREAYEQKNPAALISAQGDRFSLVFPEEIPGCKPGRGFTSLITKLEGGVIRNTYCNP